ncbi:CNBP [Acanthosepion pharaonis]|uniref:CNBP n=1 Tax=Acanthosepion pharaonis TaxID=158019 RepID=A0A812DA51_ACAPH|nr:CNBP [Sepia pharaonis]
MAKVRISSDIIKPFSGQGDVVAWLKKVRLMARLQQVDDVASLLPLYLEGDALALYMEMEEEDQGNIDLIEARLKQAFTDDAFSAYRKLTMVRWTGERVDVYANKVRQFVRLTGFEGAEMERLTKLAFIMGFPDVISLELRQAPNVEALTVGKFLARARVLTTTGNESQNVVVAVRPPRSVGASPTKSGPRTSVTCYRCSIKGHMAKDCRKCGTCCYQCGEFGHWARDCSGNATGDKASAPAFSLTKM